LPSRPFSATWPASQPRCLDQRRRREWPWPTATQSARCSDPGKRQAKREFLLPQARLARALTLYAMSPDMVRGQDRGGCWRDAQGTRRARGWARGRVLFFLRLIISMREEMIAMRLGESSGAIPILVLISSISLVLAPPNPRRPLAPSSLRSRRTCPCSAL